jgi:hypothetical protein
LLLRLIFRRDQGWLLLLTNQTGIVRAQEWQSVQQLR